MNETDNASMFSKIAHRYDLLNRVLSFNIDRTWRKRAVEAANLPPGGRVLDACTGTGDVAIDFARYSEPSTIVGLDLSGEMILVGRKKVIAPDMAGRKKVIAPDLSIEKLGPALPNNPAGRKKVIAPDLSIEKLGPALPNNPAGRGKVMAPDGVQWVEGSVLDLPLADDSFDAVTVAFGLRNLTDYGRGIAEMTRVLRPGGRLVVLEFAPPANGFLQRAYGVYLRSVVPVIGALVSGNGGAYRYLATSVGDFLTRDQVLGLMGGVGLHDLCAEPLTGGIAYIYRGEK
jgi:demethylmenaquinone methyltransferase/2-methoxy-6-polyprenyl-1,4-benzoquinol methylase